MGREKTFGSVEEIWREYLPRMCVDETMNADPEIAAEALARLVMKNFRRNIRPRRYEKS